VEHPNTRQLARYALGEITDDAELAAFEDHLLACDTCRRRAVAIDLIGTVPEEEKDHLALHISNGSEETLAALCGDNGSRNIISRALLGGFKADVLCPKCLALLKPAGESGRGFAN
jgi:hypothetical protein